MNTSNELHTDKLYLVLGPESSGTRIMTRILVSGGLNGDSGHEQRFDDEPLELPAVWRRSFPHFVDKVWPDLDAMLEFAGNPEAHAIVMTRDWKSMAESQIENRKDVDTIEDANTNIQKAYWSIFTQLSDIPFTVVSYESLVQRPEKMQRWLDERLELPGVPSIDIYDGNEKYY